MSTTELERLLWERLDGTLEGADEARLRDLLASEPGAERLEAEIAHLASRLDAAAEVQIPSGLGDGIRRALPAACVARAEHDTDPWYAGLRRLVRPQPVRRLAYLAAGLSIALVGYRLVTVDPQHDAGSFVGTAGLTEPDSAAPTVRLELPRTQGVLTISRRDRDLGVKLETAPSLGPARLVILGEGLGLEHAAQQAGDVTLEQRASDAGLEFDLAGAGIVELTISVAGGGEKITVLVLTGDETLVSHQLRTEPENRDATNY